MFINLSYKPTILTDESEPCATKIFEDLVSILTVTNHNDTNNPTPSDLYIDKGSCEFVNKTGMPYTSFITYPKDSDGNIYFDVSGAGTSTFKIWTYLKIESINKFLYLSVQSGLSTAAMNNKIYKTYTIGFAFCSDNTEVVNYTTTHKFRGKEFSIGAYTSLETPLNFALHISMSDNHMYFNTVRRMQSFASSGASAPNDEYDRYDSGILLVKYSPIDAWATSTNNVMANYAPWAFLNMTFGHITLADAAGQSLNMFNITSNVLENVSTNANLCLFRWIANTAGLSTAAGSSYNSVISSNKKEKRIHLIALNIQALSQYANCFGKISTPTSIFAINGTGHGWQDELQTLNTGSITVVHRIYPAAVTKTSSSDTQSANIKLAIPIL